MPNVILVDEKDAPIGEMEKIEAHEKGLLHRAFSVMLYRKNTDIEVLLQQRASGKYHCGGLWTNTCCSHPVLGEATLDAANRRLKEEVNIEAELHHIGSFIYKASFDNGLTEYELDHVFIGEYADVVPAYNQDEIQDLKWVALDKLEKDLLINSGVYTPWLSYVVDKVKGAI